MTDALARLIDQDRIAEVVTRLFTATDERDWAAVKTCFADSVVFDMTSIVGGAPSSVTPEHIATGWEAGLRPIQHVHHQIGNLRVVPAGATARATCHGIAYHFREHPSGRNTRVFVGSYDIELARAGERWRITLFRFNLKFIDGNQTLESDR
jgi:hypothetical protein